MKQKPLRDLKGNELKLVLLQVMERNEQGPTLCRVRYDHEVIDLKGPNAEGIQHEFLLVYTPVDSVLGEMQLGDMPGSVEEMVKYRDLLTEARAQVVATKNLLNTVERHALTQEEELRDKTNALRDLQRERDPSRLEAMVAARTQELTLAVERNRVAYGAEMAVLKSRIEELEANKRKLREALDRAKGKR